MGLDTHPKKSHYSSSRYERDSDSEDEDDYSRSDFSSSDEEENDYSDSYSSSSEESEEESIEFSSSSRKPKASKSSAKFNEGNRSSKSSSPAPSSAPAAAPTPAPRKPRDFKESSSASSASQSKASNKAPGFKSQPSTSAASAPAPAAKKMTPSNQNFTKASSHMFETGVHYNEKRDVHYTKVLIPLSAIDGEAGLARQADGKFSAADFTFNEDIVDKYFKPDISDNYDDFMTSKVPSCDYEHAKIVHISQCGFGGDHPKALALRFKDHDFFNGIRFPGTGVNAQKKHLAVIPSGNNGSACCNECVLYDCKQQALESKSFRKTAHLSCKRIYQKDLRFPEFTHDGMCQVKCGSVIDDILHVPKHMVECGLIKTAELAHSFVPRCEGKWNWYPSDAVGVAMAKFQAKVLSHMRIVKWKDLTLEWMHADGSPWGSEGMQDSSAPANDIPFNSYIVLKVGFMYPTSEPEDCKPIGPSCHSTFLSNFKNTIGTFVHDFNDVC